MKRLAIFASGNGSNAKKILDYFKAHLKISIGLIITNNNKAGIISIAQEYEVPLYILNNKTILNEVEIINKCKEFKIEGIVLAGFLRKIPTTLIEAFQNLILNIHPSLLPNFGGLGMYGKNVHEAVSKSGHNETGVTIHIVNNEYDKGKIIFQKAITIIPNSNDLIIGQKVLALEHLYYPKVIETYFLNLDSKYVIK